MNTSNKPFFQNGRLLLAGLLVTLFGIVFINMQRQFGMSTVLLGVVLMVIGAVQAIRKSDKIPDDKKSLMVVAFIVLAFVLGAAGYWVGKALANAGG